MKTFRTSQQFVVTKGNTNRKKGEFSTILHAIQHGVALCNKSKHPYFQIWYKTEKGAWRCESFCSNDFTGV